MKKQKSQSDIGGNRNEYQCCWNLPLWSVHYCHGEDERDKRLVLRIDQRAVFHSLAAAVHIQLLHVDRVRLAVLQDQKKVLQIRSPRMRHHRHPRNTGSPRPRHLRILLRRILTAAAI